MTTLIRLPLPLIAALAVGLAGCLDFGGGEPTVEVLQQVPSPNGTKVATSFYCEGGGAAGYTFHNVTLTLAGEELDPFDGLLGKHKSWHSFQGIQVDWLDDQNLEVSFAGVGAPPDPVQMSTRVMTRHGVDIHYVIMN